MKLSQPALSLLEETIKQAIGKYACGCEQTVVTDIHLQANQSSGEFSIFDDDDKELASTTIEEWMTYEGDDFYENMERILSNLLCNLKNRGSMITFVALVGSLMVSYVRARAEGLGLECKVGFMQRPERVVLTSLGALCCGIFGDCKAFDPMLILIVPMAVIAVLANLTAFARIAHCYKLLKKQ